MLRAEIPSSIITLHRKAAMKIKNSLLHPFDFAIYYLEEYE